MIFALALDVRGPRLQPDHVLPLKLELGGVFDRDDALARRNPFGQGVEKRGLAGPGAAGDQDVGLALDTGLDEGGHLVPQGVDLDQALHVQRIGAEAPDAQRGSVQRQRRDDGVDAGAVRQPGIEHGRALVDPPAHVVGDPADDPHEMVGIEKRGAGHLQPALPLDVYPVRPVDQDITDQRIAQEFVERAVPEDLVHHLAHDLLPFRAGQRHLFLQQQGVHPLGALIVQLVERNPAGFVEVHDLEELAMDAGLDLDGRVAARDRGGRRRESGTLFDHVCPPMMNRRSLSTDGGGRPSGDSPAGAGSGPPRRTMAGPDWRCGPLWPSRRESDTTPPRQSPGGRPPASPAAPRRARLARGIRRAGGIPWLTRKATRAPAKVTSRTVNWSTIRFIPLTEARSAMTRRGRRGASARM